jgi:hypothetical protein
MEIFLSPDLPTNREPYDYFIGEYVTPLLDAKIGGEIDGSVIFETKAVRGIYQYQKGLGFLFVTSDQKVFYLTASSTDKIKCTEVESKTVDQKEVGMTLLPKDTEPMAAQLYCVRKKVDEGRETPLFVLHLVKKGYELPRGMKASFNSPEIRTVVFSILPPPALPVTFVEAISRPNIRAHIFPLPIAKVTPIKKEIPTYGSVVDPDCSSVETLTVPTKLF